jgi:hypothetical protein
MRDEQLVRALEQLAGFIPGARKIIFQWRVLEGNDFNSCPIGEIRANTPLKEILGREGEILRWAQLQFQGSGESDNSNLEVSRDSTGGVAVNLNLPDAFNQDQEAKTRIAVAVNDVFGKYARSNIVDNLQPMLAEFYQRRDETLARLEELQVSIFGAADEQRRKIEDALDRERDRLERAYQEKQRQLEAEHAAGAEELARRQEELETRSKALEERDNTQTRRDLQKQLKKVLQERNASFSLTRGTEGKMLPIKITCALLIVALAGVSAWAWYKTTQPLPTGEPYWFGMVRLGLTLAALAWFVVFYVRWQNRWTEAYANEEFRLQRLDLDVDRASWLVEVLMEWRAAGGAEVPQELIARLANGLFEPGAAGALATSAQAVQPIAQEKTRTAVAE